MSIDSLTDVEAPASAPECHSTSISQTSPAADVKVTLEDIQNAQQKYAEEKEKRMRADGPAQYINLAAVEEPELQRLLKDPWDDGSTLSLSLAEGARYKVLILGAGLGALLFAVRLLEAGLKPEDIVFVDEAAGFGGTWYWNRYPGLMCDVESYTYLPLLEETGYMPKHKYSYGQEIREYANLIAEKWSLVDRALFRTHLGRCSWDDEGLEWIVELTQRTPSGQRLSTKVHADFVYLIPGLLNRPKISEFPGLDAFQGQSFHAARWDYNITGGSQEDPNMCKLKDKTVGIIGTGATAVQAVPELAKWCKHLYVFQRTPSSIDVRNQKETDPEEWAAQISTGPGWQNERNKNFLSFIMNGEPRPAVNMVDDGWTSVPAYGTLLGGPNVVTVDNIINHINEFHALDLPRSEKVRARVDEVVKDEQVADKLKAWYPSWCKRPTFHDGYLETFNRTNVTLVDTDGKGVEEITKSGVGANGENFNLDVLIFAMGFEISVLGSPSARSGAQVIGRNGINMDEKWAETVATFHGVATNGFPNMFFFNATQVGVSTNILFASDIVARHVAFIISKGLKMAGSGGKVAMEPTAEVEIDWAKRTQEGAPALAPVAGCTPSYYNGEGALESLTRKELLKAAASGPWPRGAKDYLKVLQNWRNAGDLKGLDIRTA